MQCSLDQGEVSEGDLMHAATRVWRRHTRQCEGACSPARSWTKDGPPGYGHRLGPGVWHRWEHVPKCVIISKSNGKTNLVLRCFSYQIYVQGTQNFTHLKCQDSQQITSNWNESCNPSYNIHTKTQALQKGCRADFIWCPWSSGGFGPLLRFTSAVTGRQIVNSPVTSWLTCSTQVTRISNPLVPSCPLFTTQL